jgi:hypothetical protein
MLLPLFIIAPKNVGFHKLMSIRSKLETAKENKRFKHFDSKETAEASALDWRIGLETEKRGNRDQKR